MTGQPLPVVSVGAAATPLPAGAADLIKQVVVDNHRYLPDMFEITFHDRDAAVLDLARIELGTVVTISTAGVVGSGTHTLVTGEVTAIEGVYSELSLTVVRGYTADHRLTRNRRSRTFLNVDDAGIARTMADHARIDVAPADHATTQHQQIGQVNQTDWEFLTDRAAESGYDFGVRDGKFFLHNADRQVPDTVDLRFGHNLAMFRPRVTGGNLAEETELRVWDAMAGKVVSARARTTTSTVDLPDAGLESVARTFRGKPQPAADNGKLGPRPVAGHVVNDRPVASGAATARAADTAAEHWGGTVAEAEGEALGDPRLRPGVAAEISGVPEVFRGRWVLTRTRHVFGRTGYRTRFEVSGRHDRSILGLAGGGRAAGRGRLPGLVCGIVSNIADPLGKGRVKVDLPLLSPGFETDWAPVAQLGAGTRSGAVFGHEVGDEVLVGFECADPRRPYVLGGIVNNSSTHSVGGQPVKLAKTNTALVWRGLVSPLGNRLAFHDEQSPGGGRPTAAEVVLGTAQGDIALVIDKVAGTVTVRCTPPGGNGRVVVECGGSVDIRAGATGKVTVDGGSQLDLTARAVNIRSSGDVTITGRRIKLN